MTKFRQIDSESNETFKLFLKLLKTRGVKKHGLALLSRSKHVMEVLKEFPDRCEGIILSDQHELPSEPMGVHILFFRLKAALFRRIDIYDTGQPLLLVRFKPFPDWGKSADTTGCTLCVPFQDPANVGAVIRAAAAFGVTRVVVLKEAAHPFHVKSIRVAGSAVFREPFFEGPSLYDFNVSNVPVITLSPGGRDAKDFRFPLSFCLVPGLEGPGLPDSLLEKTSLSIPMVRGVESINAAMATGIILYLWRSQLMGP